jgi:hypothetical protein
MKVFFVTIQNPPGATFPYKGQHFQNLSLKKKLRESNRCWSETILNMLLADMSYPLDQKDFALLLEQTYIYTIHIFAHRLNEWYVVV